VVAFAPAAATAAFTGSISGTVTDAETAEPVEGLEVCLWPFQGEEELECVVTGSAGEYEFSELEPGEYEVEFWGRSLGYVEQFWNGKAHWWESDPIVVESEPVTGIDAAMVLGGTIEGTVTEAAGGAPVTEVEVCAWDFVNERSAGCTETEADGTYALQALPTGEYQIEFWPYEGNLLTQLYDHKYDWTEADVLSVEAGEVVSGIDAELDAGGTISGTVYSAATGTPLKWIYVCSVEAASGELLNCTETDWGGNYALERHPPGSYKVVFSIDFEEWFEEDLEEEDDGYATQFWDNQTTLASATPISLGLSQAISGIDAHLASSTPVVQPPAGGGTTTIIINMPPAINPPPAVTTETKKPRKHCRRGFVRKKVKGKVRCVKRRNHRHRRHAHSSAGAAALPPALRPLFEGRSPHGSVQPQPRH
jgi:Carboxypeptidase regulatory-like domain